MARSRYWLIGILGTSYGVLTSCGLLPLPTTSQGDASLEENPPIATENSATATISATQPAPSATSTAPSSGLDHFREGVTRAQSAVTIGQSAQSPDDWQLAASRWQQAVQYMQQVSADDPNYATAQTKIKEYGQHLATAQKRSAGEVAAAVQPVTPDRPPGLVASIPIVEQMGGTPVVPVSLTGDRGTQQFTMLFDTGASGTLITAAMAEAVGVIVTGSATVTVADGRQVEIPVGYVNTLKVGDLVVRDLWVGIGGDVALLGQDVYGDYGLSIGGDQINLYN